MNHIVLRPLRVGELIDRALTLFMRNFALFNAMVAIVIFVPMALGQYLLFVNQAAEFRDVIAVLQHPGGTVPPVTPFAAGDIGAFAAGIVLLLAASLLGLFANNAVAVGIGALYVGRKPSMGASFRAVFSRWAAIVGIFFLYLTVGVGIYVAFVGVFFGGVVGLALLSSSAHGPAQGAAYAGFLLAFAMVPIGMLLGAVLFVLLVLAFAFAGYAVVIERTGVVAALTSALGRIFNRREIGKALVVGLVAILLGFGVSSISGLGGFLLGLLPGGRILVALWATLFAVLGATIQTSFYAVYYYDVRIRREGFDLEMALQRLAPQT